ncbi:hypothetical protein BYT27DRAFT_7183389 [Phlegmacium glaucopus]|nr:hypothetical protein BYT27DRAFT_7183389 [Phlegmacium glaucopus]
MVTGRTSLGESVATKTLYTLLPEEFSEPLLPGPVTYIERSIPMIMKNEPDEFFYPLIRRGWRIKRLEANDSFSHPNHASPFLVRKFRFKGNRSTRAFLQEIFRIESEEKHHISSNLRSEKRPVITVMTQTHSFIKFVQNIETNHFTTDVIEPALTLRDIRIAVLLENLLDDTNNLIARA